MVYKWSVVVGESPEEMDNIPWTWLMINTSNDEYPIEIKPDMLIIIMVR